MNTTMTIINSIMELTDADREALVQTYQEVFSLPPYSEQFTVDEVSEAFEAVTRSGGEIVILRNTDATVISFGAGYMRSDNTYWIEELATKPEFQRTGYGSQVLAKLEEIAKNEGACTVELRTTVANKKAIALYTKFGFVDTGERVIVPQQRVDGENSVDTRMYLRKDLAESRVNNKKLRSVVITYPSGNPTALVLDQDLTGQSREINDTLMKQFPNIEQGGFLLPATLPGCIGRIRMFGGEFCGNAARSAVWVFTQGKPSTGYLEFQVGDASRALAYTVFADGQVEIEMPLPKEDVVKECEDGILVNLDGISQLIIKYNPGENLSPEELKSKARDLLRRNDLLKRSASGVMFYSSESRNLEPVVWVRDIETYFYETACGSGTCAIGIAEAYSLGQAVEIPIKQPSGKIIVVSAWRNDAGEFKAKIKGEVQELYRGSINLSSNRNE